MDYYEERRLMARTITIKKDVIVNTAFQMLKQEGIENVTAS